MRKILCCLMFTLLCALTAAAQDVIIKKNGNTVVCRVVEVTRSEVIYKRWTELQGNNYVMDIADIASIHYENGEKKNFDNASSAQPATTMPTQRRMGELNDAELMQLAMKKEGLERDANYYKVKAKRLKRAGWTGGLLLAIGGMAVLGYGIGDMNAFDNELALPITGAFILTGGIATTAACLAQSNKLKKSAVQSTPVYGHDFQFKNGSSLSTSVCSLTDNHSLTPALGPGFSYNF